MTGALARALRAIRVGEPENLLMPEPPPMLPPVLSDQDFYRSRFQENPAQPGYPLGYGPSGDPWGQPMGAMRFGQVPGTLDQNSIQTSPIDLQWLQQRRNNDLRWAPPLGRTL